MGVNYELPDLLKNAIISEAIGGDIWHTPLHRLFFSTLYIYSTTMTYATVLVVVEQKGCCDMLPQWSTSC